MAGSAESIGMATGLCLVDQDDDQDQLFQNEHPISRSHADASVLVFFTGQCIDQSLSNCLILYVDAARK